MKTRGNSLAALLLLLALAACLTLALAQRFIARQRSTRHLEFRRQAENLAYSALSEALARLSQDRKWGTTPETYLLERHVPHLHDPQAGYRLTFDPKDPQHSLNNVAQDSARDGCPAGAALLIGQGHCNGYQARYRALVAVPPFPYALASTGPIRSQGGLVLGTVPPDYDPSRGLDLEKLLPAEMMTQSLDDASGAALVLKGNSTIVGTARAAGSVEADLATVQVRQGELLAHARTEDVPVISLEELDFGGAQMLPQSQFSQPEKLSGLLQSGGSLRFSQGLALSGATLRVKGNLEITGALTGVGALLVDGNVTLRGGAQLGADNQVAIVAQGSVSVTGQAQGASCLEGLIYAAGPEGIRLQDCTVVGTVLNAGGPSAPMQVDRATVAFRPQTTSLTLELSASGVDDGNQWARARLKTPLPLSSFFRNGAWEIPSNDRPAPTPSEPYPFSPLESVLLPHLELQLDGQWYSSVSEALAAGVSPIAVRKAVTNAGTVYAQQLEQARSEPPAANSRLAFRLDLNRYLKHSQRLRVLRLQSL